MSHRPALLTLALVVALGGLIGPLLLSPPARASPTAPALAPTAALPLPKLPSVAPVLPLAATPRAPAAPAALSAPPPPLDWDQMWFHTDNQSSAPSQIGPAAGAGTGLSVSDPTKSALMFGGLSGRGVLTNQTWVVNQTSAYWTVLSEPTAPSPRSDFSLANNELCGSALLFGGLVSRRSHEVTNDTWLFDFTTKRWTNVTGPVGPAPRQGAALAVDNRTCRAVLFGGVDQNYRSGNSTGSVRWNDTWVFYLSNLTWAPVTNAAPPPSLADAGMIFDPVSKVYLLYGGCESLCSADVWSYSLSANRWSRVTATTPILPPARGGAAWAYSPTYDVAILSDGYQLNGGALSALNDTWVYLISANRFEQLGDPEPNARFLPAGGWLSANGCPGMLLLGGGAAPTNPPDEWFLDPAPDIPLACNTWGNDSISITGGGGAGCDPGFLLRVTIVGVPALLPLPGATVTVAGNCSHASYLTQANGTAVFLIAWQPYGIWVNATNYHSNYTTYTPIPPNLNDSITIELIPLPTLVVHSWARDAFGNVTPLPFVYVSANGVPLAVTNSTAEYSQPGYEPLGAYESFQGNRSGYGSASVTLPIPFTGPFPVNLTLSAAGPFDVQVLEGGSHRGLPGALVTVQAVPTEPPNGFQGTSDPTGWRNGTLAAGNFTVVAQLTGFIDLQAPPRVFHPWARVTVVTINLTTAVGYRIDVRVLSAPTGAPIAKAHVQVGVYPILSTGRSGWANQTSVKPAGTYEVVAWADNFTSNRTSASVSYFAPIWVIVLNLTPLGGPCDARGGPGCARLPTNGTQVVPLTLWPTGPPSPPLLYGGGALLLGIPSAFLWLSRRRPSRSVPVGPP